MHNPLSLSKNFLQITLLVILVIILGEVFDNYLMSLAIVLLVLILINFYQLFKLNRWIWLSKKMSPPKVYGAWEHIYEGIYQMQRRHRAKRKELGELVKRFRQGAESLPDAVVIIDSNAKIVWCNRLARLELGIQWPSDTGLRIDNLIRHPLFVEYFQGGNFNYPIEVPSPSNANKTNEYRIMPYGEDNLILISRDVSRVSQLEDMRRDFVANVSHEMRTPLTVISGYLEMLSAMEMSSDPLQRKALFEMTSQTRRMQSLIEDLLVLSRIESSAERIYENVIVMHNMFAQIEQEAARLNQDKGHKITFYIDKSLNMYGVETEIRSACSNLVFNAINYTPEGGKIKVYWQKVGKNAIFRVIDNGDGIDDKHLLRITERFYRVDKARSRKTGGSGLGLSIVKHVLNHHNSTLSISSEVGKGSEFAFVINAELIPETITT